MAILRGLPCASEPSSRAVEEGLLATSGMEPAENYFTKYKKKSDLEIHVSS